MYRFFDKTFTVYVRQSVDLQTNEHILAMNWHILLVPKELGSLKQFGFNSE